MITLMSDNTADDDGDDDNYHCRTSGDDTSRAS